METIKAEAPKIETTLPPDAPVALGEEMSLAESFQLFFVYEVSRMASERGFSHSEFGRRVFGEHSGSRIWRVARQLGRGRSISLVDCYNMAEVLEVDLPSLLWKTTQRANAESLAEFIRDLTKKTKA